MEVGGTVERVVVLVGLPWRPAPRFSGVVIHIYILGRSGNKSMRGPQLVAGLLAATHVSG